MVEQGLSLQTTTIKNKQRKSSIIKAVSNYELFKAVIIEIVE